MAQLRRDHATKAPQLRGNTVADCHAWKVKARAFDAAQIELGIATPREVQKRNAALQVTPGRARVVQFG